MLEVTYSKVSCLAHLNTRGKLGLYKKKIDHREKLRVICWVLLSLLRTRSDISALGSCWEEMLSGNCQTFIERDLAAHGAKPSRILLLLRVVYHFINKGH